MSAREQKRLRRASQPTPGWQPDASTRGCALAFIMSVVGLLALIFWPLTIYLGAVLLSLLPAGDGGISDEEADRINIAAANAAAGQADLEVLSMMVTAVNGTVEISASMRALDTSNVAEPTLVFTFRDSVRAVSMPANCTPAEQSVSCSLDDIVSDSIPSSEVSSTIVVEVAADAVDPYVTIVATSQFNPVSNDPFPPNNTAGRALPQQ